MRKITCALGSLLFGLVPYAAMAQTPPQALYRVPLNFNVYAENNKYSATLDINTPQGVITVPAHVDTGSSDVMLIAATSCPRSKNPQCNNGQGQNICPTLQCSDDPYCPLQGVQGVCLPIKPGSPVYNAGGGITYQVYDAQAIGMSSTPYTSMKIGLVTALTDNATLYPVVGVSTSAIVAEGLPTTFLEALMDKGTLSYPFGLILCPASQANTQGSLDIGGIASNVVNQPITFPMQSITIGTGEPVPPGSYLLYSLQFETLSLQDAAGDTPVTIGALPPVSFTNRSVLDIGTPSMLLPPSLYPMWQTTMEQMLNAVGINNLPAAFWQGSSVMLTPAQQAAFPTILFTGKDINGQLQTIRVPPQAYLLADPDQSGNYFMMVQQGRPDNQSSLGQVTVKAGYLYFDANNKQITFYPRTDQQGNDLCDSLSTE